MTGFIVDFRGQLRIRARADQSSMSSVPGWDMIGKVNSDDPAYEEFRLQIEVHVEAEGPSAARLKARQMISSVRVDGSRSAELIVIPRHIAAVVNESYRAGMFR